MKTVQNKKLHIPKSDIPDLNPKQMMYARLRGVDNLPKSTAYIKSGYKAPSITQAGSLGCALEKKPAIQQMIKTLRENEWIKDALTVAEKRSFLAKAVRTPISEINADSPLVQSYKTKTTELGVETELKIVDKLQCIKLDSDLAGDFYKDRNESTANPFLFILAMGQSSQDADLDEVADVELVGDSAGAV